MKDFGDLVMRNSSKLVKFVCLLLVLISWTGVHAQENGNEAEQDSSSKIIVDFSELAEFIIKDGEEKQILTGNVELHQDSNFMYCDRAELNQDNQLIALGEVLIQQTDSVFLFSDSLYYYGDLEKAELYGNVSMVNGEYQLFSEELFYDLKTRIATYNKSAIMTDGSAQMISKRGTYYVNEDLAVFVDSVIIIDSNFVLKTDSLEFDTEGNICYFRGPTVILQDDARIYCEAGYYDLDEGKALFSENASYRNKDQYSKADSMFYYSRGSKIDLMGNAEFRDSTRQADADRIIFWQDSEVAILKGDAVYIENGRRMESDSIYFDAKDEEFFSSGRSKVWNDEQYIEATEINFPSGNEWGYAKGDVVWKDTLQNTILRSEHIDYNKESDQVLAKTVGDIRPYIISIVDGDSLWLSADTLFSFEEVLLPDTMGVDSLVMSADSILTEADSLFTSTDSLLTEENVAVDTNRILLAYHRVLAYKSDLQVVCDFMRYSDQDSMFYFYEDPIMWSDTSQFIADTIRAAMKSGSIDKIYLDQNAIILNSPDEIYFNQMQGRHIIAHFDSSELRRMYINGNAESIYYALDEEDAYIGVNRTVCSNMLVLFGNNQVEGIKFYQSPESIMTPMQQAEHNKLRLDGFVWEINRRPKSKWDVIGEKPDPDPEPESEETKKPDTFEESTGPE